MISIKDVVYYVCSSMGRYSCFHYNEVLLIFMSASAHDQSASASVPDNQSVSASAPDDQSVSESAPDDQSAPAPDDQTTCELLLNANLSVDDGNINVLAWLNEDATDPGYQLLSDEDIIKQVTAPNQTMEDDDDDDGEYPAEF